MSLSYASADFNQAYLGVPRGALTFFSTYCGLDIQLAGSLSLKPHIEAYVLLDEALRDSRGNRFRANFGLSLILSNQ